ncbi:MAG: hypothetical protein A2900_03820 [Candidatus Chisholmbacteria bacterium RIFCSPLOWO2_01_FULL_50_28]|uniref:Uncharacterized protein n=1 Tax=Candidatus Chisholmbacteria bacterium RIFCSPHIGHO2_01_FULL_52_32 TaxID=1797591 RepID=A0A1G1VSP6_9BACT|nr:MAG: hypothetical protein A2786_02925 [Candidatus Chisholmbacteria bacterium RIFCSPHIGHO2_01_FULL_52_32]OGY20201.1 MAG: hypothetical protein A2900_03820 [Candidatus Chisholmbacteria bacterium RIFCSPLOWO2_01_FULL_50_28]
MRTRIAVILWSLLLSSVVLACRFESDVIENFLRSGGAEATYQAMFTPADTPTPRGQVECDFLDVGCKTVTPSPPKEVPSPGPTATSFIVLRSVSIKPANGDWAPYFEEPDDIGDYDPGSSFSRMGVMSRGLSVSVIEEIQGGRFLKVLLSGDMELNDLDIDFAGIDPQQVYLIPGETRCVDHTWKHTEDESDCHAHFWYGTGARAQISEGMRFIITSQSVVRLTIEESILQVVQVMILDPVWIRCQDTATGCPSGTPQPATLTPSE